MSKAETSTPIAEFRRPAGIVIAFMGVLFILAAFGGVIMVAVLARSYELKTIVLTVLGFAGGCALGLGGINAWRSPMLAIRPDRLTVQTFFGTRDIPIKPGQKVGEVLLTSVQSSGRKSQALADRKSVNFFTRDAKGVLTKFASMNRAAPELAQIRHALNEIAGVEIEQLEPDPKAKNLRPDVSHWP